MAARAAVVDWLLGYAISLEFSDHRRGFAAALRAHTAPSLAELAAAGVR